METNLSRGAGEGEGETMKRDAYITIRPESFKPYRVMIATFDSKEVAQTLADTDGIDVYVVCGLGVENIKPSDRTGFRFRKGVSPIARCVITECSGICGRCYPCFNGKTCFLPCSCLQEKAINYGTTACLTLIADISYRLTHPIKVVS
jgi:hypothetical protein